MNSSVWRDVRSQSGSRSGSGDMIVRLRDGNRIWRVSPDREGFTFLVWICRITGIMVYFWPRPSRANVHSFCLGFSNYPLLMEFIPIARATMRRASIHFDFSFDPVNFRIVIPKPRVSKQQFLFSEASNGKHSPFRMVLVTENLLEVV